MKARLAWVVVVVVVTVVGLKWEWRGGEGKAVRAGAGVGRKSAATATAANSRGSVETVRTGVKSSAEELSKLDPLRNRLSNTREAEKRLQHEDRGLLLANALIDTREPLSGLKIPERLRAGADNGNWLVQARGPVGDDFRALLAGSGAAVVSYIPNNAELVRCSAAEAGQLRDNPLVAAVVPYEPYYKLTDAGLLAAAVNGEDLSPDVGLRVGVFPGAANATMTALQQLGAEVRDEGPSPFGEILGVHPAKGTLVDVAQLSGVMVVEAEHRRVGANDLMRPRLGVALNGTISTDYLGLTGTNVLVDVNDSGVDASHPDLTGRIFLDPTTGPTDLNGHGTHVIGTILGSGVMSGTVPVVPSGSVSNANYRGMAPGAQAYVVGIGVEGRPQGGTGSPASDAYLQEAAAKTNAVLSNNSWDYDGDAAYDMAAASYDQAVRDSLPGVTGPQGLAYVFAAGNGGGGGSDGSAGIPGTILSPGTAKNVITVGAIEALRNITNKDVVDGASGQPWLAETDSSNQVASFSARGPVGAGVEGPAGRFKPDVVAPGTFVLSDKSGQWDQAGYYNPTNYTENTLFNQSVTNGGLSPYSIFVPPNAVALTISAVANDFSVQPFPALPIYVRFIDNPTTNTFDAMGLGTVTVSLPQLPAGSEIFYSVGDTATNGFVSFDVDTVVATTNDNGNLLMVLSNLNASLGPYYRYESGTSMSTAGVTGMLALMKEYLGRLGMTNPSPALLKAMLINGARTVGAQYDFGVGGALTSQGWGLPNLSNSIPGVLTNGGASPPVQLFDQWTNQLATGQSQTRLLKLTNGAGTQPLRITLVWTDPPGNPAAGVKLVNDLDLVVSNLDNGSVFYGNDIPAGSDYNQARAATNSTIVADSVNNVENVYLFPPLGTNYTVTVYGHRVNVNAVDSNTNGVVQDYALVMSYGDGGVTSNAFTVTPQPVVGTNNAGGLTVISNGIPLLNQRVGGNAPYTYLYTNIGLNLTNGTTNQWRFYVYTNTPSISNAAYKNVAFVTFDPANLGVPIMGAREEANPANGARVEADIDLYVSTDPNLTNLNPASVNAAFQSVTRTGTEKVLLTNQPQGQVYYVGIKSEDQEGGQYAFVAVALTNSFGQQDTNGNITLTVITPPLPTTIPGGTPQAPGSVTVLALTTVNVQARKVVVEDQITHQEFGDLVGVFGHGTKTVVLNNHSFFVNPGDPAETLLYDDTGENDPLFTPVAQPPFIPATAPYPRHTDGPGSLEGFTGDNISDGIWTLSMINDSSPGDTGTINNLIAVVEPQQPTNGFDATLPADSWFYDFVDVPAAATNLVITVGLSSTPGPVDLYVRRGAFPDANDFDKALLQIMAPGTNLTISTFDSPPLNAGRYFIGIFNPSPTPQTVSVRWNIGLLAGGATPLTFLSVGNELIADDAVTDSTNHVGVQSKVVSAEVGVRINHPRESDLVLTLVDPEGKRVLLAENRGGLDTNGYGHGVNVTNFIGSATAGSFTPSNTVINVGQNSGTLLINYNFFTIPDDLRVYYGGTRIFDSGLVSGAGTFAVDFGPGSSSTVTIAMNELGSNPNGTNGDAWTYQVTEITKAVTYATFTEDTNKTTLPIKFAIPPFGAAPQFLPTTTNLISDFEVATGNYLSGSTVDGWLVLTNLVTVTNNPAANTGTRLLSLHNGNIRRTLPPTSGTSDILNFAYRRSAPLDPVGWWPGENNGNDIVNGNNGTLNNMTFAPGKVNQAFSFNGSTAYVGVPAASVLNVGAGAGFTIDCWFNPTSVATPQPLLEWDTGVLVDSAIGAHLWFSVPGAGGPGGLFANLKNGANNFILFTGPGIVTNGGFQHAALSYDKASGVAKIYYNGVVVVQATTSPGYTPATTAEFDIGKRTGGGPNPSGQPGTVFGGLMDEIGVYDHALTDAQVQDIYNAGSLGRCGTLTPPSMCPPVQAAVSVNGTLSGIITATATNWTTQSMVLPANASGPTLEVDWSNCPSGMLLDTFQFISAAMLNPANDYLPEESLGTLTGDNASGDWKLEVWDNRLGATNPAPDLVSWELSLVLERVNPGAIPLQHGIPNTNTVAANSIAYYVVDVPVWAKFATNILTVTNGTASLLFNQNFLPATTNGDVILLNNQVAPSSNSVTLNTVSSVPPLIPGQAYYLAVTNAGAVPAGFTIEVDFDITPLTNLVPITNQILAANAAVPRYFQYDVSSNAVAVSYLLYNLSGNVDLVARRGPPLPTLSSYDYRSINPGTNAEDITISSNSLPVALTPGRWYLGVYNKDVNPVVYTIEAAELVPVIIPLTNDQRMTNTFGPVQSMETFFSFTVTNSPAGVLFELYSLNGNVDLTVDLGTLPFSPPFFASSSNPGTNEEQIVLRTNLLGMNLNGTWYLGVPNQAGSNVTFTIHAVVTDTNGLLISGVPIAPVVAVPVGGTTGPILTWATVNGECYEVDVSADLINWVPLGITPNPVTAGGTTTTVIDPNPIIGSPARYYRIKQVTCP